MIYQLLSMIFPDQFLNSLFFLTFQDTVTFLSRGVTENSATLSTGERLIISSCLLDSVPTKLMTISNIVWIKSFFQYHQTFCYKWWHSNKFYLNVVSAAFLLIFWLSPNKRTCQARKNVFHFTSKALFILEKIKF